MVDKILFDFIFALIIKMALYFVIWYLTGLLVVKKGMKVNYTRKINHFSLMVIPFLLDMLLKSTKDSNGDNNTEEGMLFSALGLLLGLSYFLLFLHPVRTRVGVLNTAFHSIDRPEDRPYTLPWITTQSAANYLVTIPFASYLMMIDRMELVFIVMLINGIGDGLAEPVGIRFGKHKYQTRALFTLKKYTRSIEGSSCVFITTLLTIILFGTSFSTTQFIILLVTMPILMTLAETFAPHSWDNPFLSTVGQILLFLVLQFMS